MPTTTPLQSPKVSVCLDSYNYGRFLPEAIESVLRQSFQDFEIVISDDRSTDDSFAIAQRYARQDPRIIAVQNEQNLGMVRNRNACLARARGELVKPLHADDFLCSTEALARMVATMEKKPAIVLLATARQIVDEQGRSVEKWSCFEERERPLSGVSVINRCLFEQRNLIGGPSAVMFRRVVGRRGFDEAFFVMADLEMWFHLLEQGCFYYLAEPLCAFRQHGRQQTEKDRTSLAPALENHELLRRYLHKPYVRLRRWIWKYLEYDAVRRIIRRSRKLGAGQEQVAAAIEEYGGWHNYRTRTPRNLSREVMLKVRRLYERHLRRPLRIPMRPRPRGINLAGFVQSEFGIGESSRAMWRAVQATQLPCVLINVRSTMHRNHDASFADFAQANPYRVNLMTFSFDYARRFARDMGPRFFVGRHNIGLWYWEQELFPLRWHSAFDYYDEIWVPSEFTRRSIAAASPIPVHKITYPFFLNEVEARPNRAHFGFPEDAFVFLFNFDFMSTTDRKNPLGVVEAFRRGFRPDDNAVLVMKSINWEHNRAARAELERRAGDARVIFLDPHLPGAEVNSLFASVDSYVSLHRSEGLGLGMAQAMYLGKPVIGTGYSGNLDFMNAENSLLVNFTMTELEEDSGPYVRGTHWAAPDEEHAASLMRWVYENREASRALGARAAADIRRTLSPQTTAREIRERVENLDAAPAIAP